MIGHVYWNSFCQRPQWYGRN